MNLKLKNLQLLEKSIVFLLRSSYKYDIMVKKGIYKIKRYKLTSIFYKTNYEIYTENKGAKKWLLDVMMIIEKCI